MDRVKFPSGGQRKFLKEVLERISCPSLREVIQRGFDINYSTLKNYYTEKRLLPLDFFKDLCHISKINEADLNVKYLNENFGQVIGGKKSKRIKRKRGLKRKKKNGPTRNRT